MHEGHETASLPQIEELAEAGSMRPPSHQKPRGRNQHNRIQSGGHQHQTGKGGVLPSKCTKCGVSGHRAAACRVQGSAFSGAFSGTSAPRM